MSAIIRRRNNLPAKTMTRQEFLTPFDRIFDDMFGNMFPTLASDFGDYYSKSKVGKFMGSLDDRFGKLGDAYSKSKAGKFMGKMDKAISNPKSLFSGKKSKRNKAVK